MGIWSITRFNDLSPNNMVAEVKREQQPSPAMPAAAAEEAAVSTTTDAGGAILDPQAPASGDVIEKQANGSGADPNIEGLVAVNEMELFDVVDATTPVPEATRTFNATVTSEEAEEDVSTVFFDARTATDSTIAQHDLAEAAPAREVAAQEVMIVTEGTATRAQRKRDEDGTKSKGVMELEKDNNSAMANSRALDQRLLSLQNAAW